MPELLFAVLAATFWFGLSSALKPRPPKPDMWTPLRVNYFAGEGPL